MKRLIGYVLLFVAVSAYGINCDSIVSDDAGILQRQGKLADVQQAAQKLIEQGADPRIFTTTGSTNLDLTVEQFLQECNSWQGPNRKMKSTLVVLGVSSDTRKLGIAYGAAWKAALDNHWNRIKQDYMVPRFRDGDWAGGFIATEDQLALRLAASKDEALHPQAGPTTVNQAEDLSGLWTIIEWILVIGGFGGLLVFGLVLLSKRKQARLDVDMAQQNAIAQRNNALRLITSMKISVNSKPEFEQEFNGIQDSYAQIANSEKNNPEAEGLTEAEYRTIGGQYESISNDLRQLRAKMVPKAAQDLGSFSNVGKKHTEYRTIRRKVEAEPEKPQPTKETVVVQQSGGDNLGAFVLGEMIGSESREREPERYREPDPEPSYRSRERDDDSSSSSDFGGGSSDFGGGGGGGSDFGGGSSDF